MKRSFIIEAIIYAFLLIFFACSDVSARTFTDDMGRVIEISKEPVRIVSLAPSITEMLFYLGLGERVVGVTDFCDYPPEVKARSRVGLLSNPDIEKIITLKPDIVFATTEGNRADTVHTLEKVNINVYVFSPHNMEDILREILAIGEITGHEGIAREKVTELEERIRRIKGMARDRKKIKTLFLLSITPLISAGRGSFINDLIESAGGINILASSVIPYPRVDMEILISMMPEVIIVTSDMIESLSSLKDWWKKIPAVKNHRIYPVDSNIIKRPGPRVVDALESIYKYLHEE